MFRNSQSVLGVAQPVYSRYKKKSVGVKCDKETIIIRGSDDKAGRITISNYTLPLLSQI